MFYPKIFIFTAILSVSICPPVWAQGEASAYESAKPWNLRNADAKSLQQNPKDKKYPFSWDSLKPEKNLESETPKSIDGKSAEGGKQHADTAKIFSSPTMQDMYKITSQRTLASRLKDPDSAQFKNVYFNKAIIDGKPTPMVCGEVNSKNGFGAYTGYQGFIASGSSFAFLESEAADFADSWNTFCER